MGKVASDVAADETLVPVKMLVSEAGLGLRTGEIRGFSKEIAEKLIANKQAEAVKVEAAKTPAPAAKS